MRIDSSLKAYHSVQKWMASDVEEFWAVALNPDLQMIEKKLLFRGTVDSCPVHPRDLIRFLCLQNASSFVIAHNHPSGNLKPSSEDIQITKRLYLLTRILEIRMIDHVIVGPDSYFSFADSGWLTKFESQKLLRLRPYF